MPAPANRSFIALEGWRFIVPAVVIVAGLHYVVGTGWAFLLWVPVLGLLYMFREPARRVPPLPMAVICPADGTVVDNVAVHDRMLDREAVKISVKMSVFGGYAVRSPVEGKVMEQWFPKGETLTDTRGVVTGECRDVRHAQWIRTDEVDDVVVCISAGVHAIRPRCYAQSGERLGQGYRCGYMPFGARIDVLVPASSRIEVQVGQHVRAGTDVLATLIHK